MEMMEGQNQSPKRINFQEIVEKGEVDRISALPDCVLIEILSRLPYTKDAIRTGTLSKRWKHLWTLLPTLIFRRFGCTTPKSDFFSFVDKTLTQCRQLKLMKFSVDTSYDIQFELQVQNWIRFAIRCNVEELILNLWAMMDEEFQLDQIFFTSSCFTNLTLQGCILNPTKVISWKNLRSLSINYDKLDEKLIENILSGSPLLETLVLDDCFGYGRLNIASKSVKNLVLSGYINPECCNPNDEFGADIIEINAPNILSLTIQGELLLWKVLLLDVSSLAEAKLNHKKYGHCETTHYKEQEEMLKGFILNLCHVKEITIGVFCRKVVSRLEDKGFVFPSNVVKLPNDFSDESDVDESDSDSFDW